MTPATSFRYYRYANEYGPLAGGTTYMETEEDWALRQITVHGEQHIMSNRRIGEYDMELAEGRFDIDEMEPEVVEITRTEFEAVWQRFLVLYDEAWSTNKQKYRIGSVVHGWIEFFYPQGTIVNLGDGALGVADYEACRISAAPGWMYPGHKITATVAGYDEENHWIVLDSPAVMSEQVSTRQRMAWRLET